MFYSVFVIDACGLETIILYQSCNNLIYSKPN